MIVDLILAVKATTTVWSWLRHLGGIGLVLLAIADHSVVPLPGSLDALNIVLTATTRNLWWYYALMSTAGSMIGAYLTYRIGRKGGKGQIMKRLPEGKGQMVFDKFERGGFATVFLSALVPPPFPMTPVMLAAGALDYPPRKFLAAMGAARLLRYGLEAYLASIYGRQILRFLLAYRKPLLWTLISLTILGAVVAIGFYIYRKHWRHRDEPQHKAA